MWEFHERRIAQRLTTRLLCKIVFFNDRSGGVNRQITPLVGYTRNVSSSGLAVVVSSIKAEHSPLTDIDSILIVELTLPNGEIEMRARPVRIERLGKDDVDKGRLIGMKIEHINENVRERFEDFLYALGWSGEDLKV